MPCKSDKDCDEGKICNPDTGRCVDKKGAAGKKILEARKKSASPSSKKEKKAKRTSASPKRKLEKVTATGVKKHTVKELKDMLAKYKVDYDSKAKKEDLVSLYVKAHNKRAKCCKLGVEKCCEKPMSLSKIRKLIKDAKKRRSGSPKKTSPKKTSPKKASPMWFEEEFAKMPSRKFSPASPKELTKELSKIRKRCAKRYLRNPDKYPELAFCPGKFELGTKEIKILKKMEKKLSEKKTKKRTSSPKKSPSPKKTPPPKESKMEVSPKKKTPSPKRSPEVKTISPTQKEKLRQKLIECLEKLRQ